MAKFIGFLILIIDVVVVLEIIRGNKDVEKKILWIIAVVFLPVLGPILYFIMGRK
ncbi:MAG: PLDc_N domain-containing protein [Cyclobacteriaceae bacterium]|jgi:hypothetical protein|nr:PLDc_N domain-containing protein [Cyclobacteriaceae bacterium]